MIDLILTVNSSIISENTCIDDIMDVIDSLKLSEYSIIILENQKTKDYIQSICNRFHGIVEMRVNNDLSFKHYKAVIPDFEDNKIMFINTGSFNMKIETSNFLNILTIKRIMIDFLNKNNSLTNFHWLDITNEFMIS